MANTNIHSPNSKTMKAQGSPTLPMLECTNSFLNLWVLRYNHVDIEDDDNNVEFDYKEYVGKPTYDEIVSTLIRVKYSQDAVEAIICNKLANEDTEDEFSILETYRNQCKTKAQSLLNTNP